jgi:GMP synthase-like glutamine amidotransferase
VLPLPLLTPKMSRILRVAILSADTLMDSIVQEYGDYYRLYTQLLQRGLQLKGWEREVQLETVDFDVVQIMSYPEHPETFDAFLISGSKSSAYEDEPWILRLIDYVRYLIEKVPTCRLVGICFGHQIICRALGGRVVRNVRGWELGWTEITLSTLGKKILGTERDTLRLQSVHQDHVVDVPVGFECLASTELSPIQMIWKKNHIFCVQAHPEFPSGLVCELILKRKASGVIPVEVADAALARADRADDSDWLGGWIVTFMLHRDPINTSEILA